MKSLLLDEFFETFPSFQVSSWGDITHIWDPLFLLQQTFEKTDLGSIAIDIPEGVWIENSDKVSIGRGTKIEPGVFIQGPCFIGENCTLRQGAYLRPYSWIGNECLIGHDTEVKHSILFDHVKAAHFAYIGDSIIGCRVNIGAGVILANFRLDQKEVPIFFQKKKVYPGLKKLGSILSDNVHIGCNCVLSPGTIIGANSSIYPCLHVKGCIPAHSTVKSPNTDFCIIPKERQ